MFFLCKQKTAYELRISDWSSDVCSSDLTRQDKIMKGDEKVIDFLNEALKNELTAINQYWLHYRMLDNWGVARLAHFECEESIDEMKHADKLADRILFLGGLPNFQ